jgi:hypothetical protein
MVSHIRFGSPVARHSESEWFSDSVSCGVCCCASLTELGAERHEGRCYSLLTARHAYSCRLSFLFHGLAHSAGEMG